MSDPDPCCISIPSVVPGTTPTGDPPGATLTPCGPEYTVQPLMNLSVVSSRMDSLHCFLSASINRNVLLGQNQMDYVSSEISSAIQQVIINGAALLAASPLNQVPNLPAPCNQNPNSCDRPIEYSNPDKTPRPLDQSDWILNRVPADWTVEGPKPEPIDEEMDETDETGNNYDVVVELDSVELLAEHVHICEICGKGFKRDANLRMHMRAHGDQYKRPEALLRPAGGEGSSQMAAGGGGGGGRKMRFSCPFTGCNRNKKHKKFKPLKSVICVKNHFKRTHCPKMYACTRCHKKSFSVLADLKSHLKSCGGESKWKCSCGTTFSRKDKLFGHMALFEGHMPAISEGSGGDGCEDGDRGRKSKNNIVMGMGEEEEVEDEVEAGFGMGKEGGGIGSTSGNCLDDRSFDRSGGINDQNLHEMLGCFSPDFVQQFCNF